MQINFMTKNRAKKALLLAKKLLPVPARLIINNFSRLPAVIVK